MHLIALVAAVICATIAALLGFGVFNGSHTLGWLALAVGFIALAGILTGPWPWPPRA